MPTFKQELTTYLHTLGFELAGFTRPDAIPPAHLDAYRQWIAAGRHAEMAYLASERALTRRADPTQVLPGVRSIVVVGLRYSNPGRFTGASGEPKGRVAAYAQGHDYHDVIPPRLEQAARFLEERLGHPVGWRAYSDTGPILEREYAMAAGLGWIGKNTCLISPNHGSYFLLGVLLLDVELEPDAPVTTDHCGTCRRCIEACPTGCIREDRTLDATRCISYLTIENKGAIPAELREKLGNWVFGCDVCQQVCPWNVRFATAQGDPELAPADESRVAPGLRLELRLDAQGFNRRFKGTPLQRPRRRGYLRNVAVAMGNRADPADLPALAGCLADEPEPLVRAHAAWAVGEIGGEKALRMLEDARMEESDPQVLLEINAVLNQARNG